MNNQRMLNKDFGINVHEMSFLGDLKLHEVKKFIETTAETCPQCLVNKKTHYCVEPNCKKHELICFNCSPSRIQSDHYLHEFTYVLPLFCKNIFENFLDIKNNLFNFDNHVQGEIAKIKNYLKQMESIAELTQKHIQELTKAFQLSNYEHLVKSLHEYSQENKKQPDSKTDLKLKNFFHDIKFYSAEECGKMEEKIIAQLMQKINALKWLQNPQKEFKLMLEIREQELKRDLFLSSKKKIEVSEIDHFFKINNEFFTETLRTHRIELKVENQFSNKSKFYEALVYHLKDGENLCIDNAHMNQIRTPLTFRNLKELEFNCNTETQIFNLRIENVSDQLRHLKVRKLREEDIRVLKLITVNCNTLKKLHLEFYNKVDLSLNKDLCELFMHVLPTSLESLYLKLRTENEVKRTYGYLSKFNKEGNQSTHLLNNALQEFLKKANLVKIVIEGVRPINASEVLDKLQKMPKLTFFKVYYDNIDLMGELQTRRVQDLEKLCKQRRRMIYSLLKGEKEKKISRKTLKNLTHDFLI